MTNAIKIGKVINEILETMPSNLGVGKKVFPIVAELDTAFPFVIYTRESVTPSKSTKDGWIGDLVTFRIDVLADKYNANLDIANAVRELFEKPIINSITNRMQLQQCYLSGINESWDSNTYITQMRFTCVVRDLQVD